QRIEFDRFRVLAALEIESRAAKETELVRAIDMVVGERGVVPRQLVPVEFQQELVVLDDGGFLASAAWIKSILALRDADDVLDARQIEPRCIADNRDESAFLFVADKEEENVFKNRSCQASAVSVIVEGGYRHPDPRAFAHQIFVAADAVNRSVKGIVAAAGDRVDGCAREIALAHVERRDVNAKLID